MKITKTLKHEITPIIVLAVFSLLMFTNELTNLFINIHKEIWFVSWIGVIVGCIGFMHVFGRRYKLW